MEGWAPGAVGHRNFTGCCKICVKTAGLLWVENQLFRSSVEISTLEGMGIWGLAVSKHSSLPETLLWKGKNNFLPFFSLFSHSQLSSFSSFHMFFPCFALKEGERESETRQEAEEFRGLVHIIKYRFFKRASSEKSGFLFEVTLPIEEKIENNREVLHQPFARNGQSITCGKQALNLARRRLSWKDEDAAWFGAALP